MKKNKSSPFPNNTLHSIYVQDVAFPNNYGVGKIDGYVVFVPGAVPGDQVRIEIMDQGNRFGYGKIASIEKYSPFRVEPFCTHFGLCGGCTLQNLAYNQQLVIKENYLRQTLKRVGNIDFDGIDVSPITPSPEISFYRSKVELAFGETDGHITLGLRERVSPFEQYQARVVSLRECKVFSPLTEKIIPIFTSFAQTNKLIPYSPLTRQGFLRHLVIRKTKSGNNLMIILETRAGALPDMKQCLHALAQEVPEVISFYHAINNGQTDVVRYEKIFHIAGEPVIDERLGPFTFRVHPKSFFQPNIMAAEGMYRTIGDLPLFNKNKTILGLYCGMGSLEISLSSSVGNVVGIDSLPENITNAIDNCRTNGVTNCSFHTSAVEDILKKGSFHNPDILIIDPPRTGITKAAMKVILDLHPSDLVYVSCSPSTLARDLKYFLEQRYTIKKIAPFDFFPHTSHLETLVCLQASS